LWGVFGLGGVDVGGQEGDAGRVLSDTLRAAVIVVVAPPDGGLVAPAWCAVKPLVHAPQAVQPARVRRVGVVYNAVLEHERAHAGPFSRVRRPVRSNA